MSTIDSKNNGKPAPEALQGKGERKPAKKAAAKAKEGGTNKKAEVIAMMKRAKGASRRSMRRRLDHKVPALFPDLFWRGWSFFYVPTKRDGRQA